eukprot:6481258-Amphidinium_carterae.1
MSNFPGAAVLRPQAAKSSSEAWLKSHEKLRSKLQSGSSVLWCDTHELHGLPSTARVVDALNLTASLFKNENKDAGQEQVLIDFTQDMSRKPFQAGAFRTITRTTEFYSFSRDRVVLPAEHLCVLGWCNVKLEELSPGEVKDLAGDGMALPVIGLVVLSMLCSGALTEAFPLSNSA